MALLDFYKRNNKAKTETVKTKSLLLSIYLFLDQKRKLEIVKRIQKQISKFELKPEDLGYSNSLIMNVEI